MAQGEAADEALPRAGALAPIGAVLRRSARSGSSGAEQLTALAQEMRAEAHFEALERARKVATLSALPLGLCLLPAFLMLAVVPSVLGLGGSVLQ